MYKRWIAIFISIVYFAFGVTLNLPPMNAEASGVDNIVARANFMYNTTWVAQEDVTGWYDGDKYYFENGTLWDGTFHKGNTYRIPYGQPAQVGKYIGFGVSVDSFLAATKDSSSVFYTSKSYWVDENGNRSPYSTYYASDCSSFVSYCWGVSKTTTANWKNLNVTSLGSAGNASNVSKFQPGDALNSTSVGHIVLVTAVNVDGTYEITEQTPPQMKRTTYTASQICSKYRAYTIYRYNNRDNVPAPPNYDPNAPSNIFITGYDGPQEGDVLSVGANCGLYGTIISTHPLSKVWGGVYNRDGSKVDDYCYYSESTSVTNYSLRGTFNNSIIFDYLPEGFYTFRIEATDSKGYSKVVVSTNFQVGNPAVFYTVTLNANGGSVSPTSITVSANGTYSGLPNPSKMGYAFAGWYTSDGTKKENGSSIASNSNHTLTARWTANTYMVVFNANGGTSEMSQKLVSYDTKYGILAGFMASARRGIKSIYMYG